MKYIYSALTNSFYPISMMDDYKNSGTWPDDGIELMEGVYVEFSGIPPEGKMRVPGKDGLPAWQDTPPLTKQQTTDLAEQEIKLRIKQANDYINNKQWPGKAALSRLKNDEISQYNLWLDYLDALEAVDTSSAQTIKWPSAPSEV